MAIKRFFSNADNTITDAFKASLTTRGTGSNAGQSDILEVFSIFGQGASGSLERSRALVNFNVSKIKEARDANTIPASGSVKFFLTKTFLIIKDSKGSTYKSKQLKQKY